MGLNMKEKRAVTREYKPRYQKASKKREKISAGRIHKSNRLPQEIRSPPVKSKADKSSHALHKR